MKKWSIKSQMRHEDGSQIDGGLWQNIALSILLLLSLYYQTSFAQGLPAYSNSELEELEKEFVQLINQSDSVERNPLANQYVNHIGEQLARFAQMPAPHFFIVKSQEINAFAGPGGHIGLNSQLILTSGSESELAAVMAHELAHVRLHHLYSLIEHRKQMRIPMLASLLASAALGVLNPTAGLGAMMASTTGFAQDSINFTRAKEKEADRIGINMLSKAGFNPSGMPAFFKKMLENTRYYYTANIPAILRSHPLDEDRIAEAENRILRLPKRQHMDSLDYALFKELIRASVTMEQKQLLEYYEHQCPKHTGDIACQYGHALTFFNMNQFQKAIALLQPLVVQYKDNLYLEIALVQAEIGLHQYETALSKLVELHHNYPDHYAVLMVYGQSLMAANQAEKATFVLLKGTREYPRDLALCRELARAQAAAHHPNYAYFTQSQCLLLEGQERAAVAQLKTALALSKNDPYLKARIEAKIDEIKSN